MKCGIFFFNRKGGQLKKKGRSGKRRKEITKCLFLNFTFFLWYKSQYRGFLKNLGTFFKVFFSFKVASYGNNYGAQYL
jgi:hypothetical protein